MNFTTLKHRFDNHYLLKLLRSKHGPLFISFIILEFKTNHIVSIEFNTLIIKLCNHLEECSWEIPENQEIEEYSRKLIENWCNDDYRLLRRFYSKNAEMFIELTVDSERSIKWMEELNPKEYIGTESRFNLIFNMLEELSSGINEDPEIRLKELKEQKRAIDTEIKDIKSSGKVRTLDQFQIEERFNQVSLAARDLLSDFKEVDNNFRKLVHDFYLKGLEEESRGELLGSTLDGYSELLDSPQGRSFSGFWNFLIADMGRDKIGKMVNQIYSNLDKDTQRSDRFLINLKKYLHNYGQNILNTNHKLAAKLNRILSDPKKRENKRLHALIQDIKTEILGTKDDINIKSRDFITIDGFPEINLPLERPLSYPEIKKVYETPIKESADITDFAKLFSFHALEREEVYKGIKDKLEEEDRAYLSDIVKDIPVKHGLEEILTYYDIASSDPKCTIVKNEKIIITYIVKSIEKKIELPEIIFCS